MEIIKRSGKVENLSKKKIYDSISKANDSVEDSNKLTQKQLKRISESVYTFCENMDGCIEIDKLEDIIENKIMESSAYEVAKRYITYRYEKERVRRYKSLTEKLTASNVKNQNANVDEFSFGGRIGETASFVTKQYALEHLTSKKTKKHHVNNEIYIHDLDSYAVGSHNCLSIPFDKLLRDGFNTRQADVRGANSINTAFQLVAVIFQIQSLQQFGGVSATHIDWTMIPYVRKSFKKHWLTGMRYIDAPKFKGVSVEEVMKRVKISDTLSIDAEIYQSKEDVYKYAMDQTVKELEQAVEGLYHNLNTLQSRSGSQLPFSSLNYGTCTLIEGRIVTKALLEGLIKGVGKFHKTSIFPCGIFQCKNGINRKPGDPNYDLFKLALKSTASRIYPNYANCDWSVDLNGLNDDRSEKQKIINGLSTEDYKKLVSTLKTNNELCEFLMIEIDENKKIKIKKEPLPHEIMSTMGCRTYNGFDISSIESYKKNISSVISSGVLYDDVQSGMTKDGRGNICPTTIIMPTIAMQAIEKTNNQCKKSHEEVTEEKIVETFMKLLDKTINDARDMLLERYDWICSQPSKSATFMYENKTMSGYIENEGIKSALRHGTLVIGQLGLYETLMLLIKCDHTTEKGMCLAKKIEQLFKDKCAKFKKELKINFGVYYSPVENVSYTALKLFKEKYGEIPGVSDKEFFTNSIHVPVWYKISPFEKIDIESKLTGFSSGGCITYVELDASVKNNIDAMEELVNYAMDKDIPYFAINVPIDTCECGFQGDLGNSCPRCGSDNIQRLRRVTGYITGNYKTAFNPGKQQEVEQRKKHTSIEV